MGLFFAVFYIVNHLVYKDMYLYPTAIFATVFNTAIFLILAFVPIGRIANEKILYGVIAGVMTVVLFSAGFLPVGKRVLEERNVPETHLTNRLYRSRWGVFIHYLDGVQNNPNHPSNNNVGATDWDACVNDFDVELLAAQLHECGAHFLYITLMQGSRYMIAPNARYDEITGMRAGEACSQRDLVSDLYDALEPYGIDLYLYTTGDGPHADEVCGPKMGFVDGKVSVDFVRNWSSVMKEYALRYGDKIKGWWFDGCYRKAFGYTDELMKIYYDAVKEGNPNAVVAFNNGVAGYYRKNYSGEDYVCGEFNHFNVVPHSRFIDGAQAFLLVPLGRGPSGNSGSDWSFSGCRYSGEYMKNFVACCNKEGGVVAVEVGMKRDGSLYPEQFDVLKQIKS